MLKRLAATTAIAATLGTLQIPEASSATAPGVCPNVHIISVAGTAESSPQDDPTNVTGFAQGVNFAKELDAKYDTVTSWQLPYTASAGALASLSNTRAPQALPYGASRMEGTVKATEHITEVASQCPDTKFVLTGFSQGATVAGDVAANIMNGKVPGVTAQDLLATYLVADPGRAQITTTPGTTTTGETGLRGKNGEIIMPLDGKRALTGTEGLTSPRSSSFTGSDVLSFCHPDDVACAAEPGGILQRVGKAANEWTSDYPHHLAAGANGLRGVDLVEVYRSAVGIFDITWLPNAILSGNADRVAPVLERAAQSANLTPQQREAVQAANQEVLMLLRAIRDYPGVVPEYQGEVLAQLEVPEALRMFVSMGDSKRVMNLLPYVANMMPHHLSYFTGSQFGPWTVQGKAVDTWIHDDLDKRIQLVNATVTTPPVTSAPDTPSTPAEPATPETPGDIVTTPAEPTTPETPGDNVTAPEVPSVTEPYPVEPEPATPSAVSQEPTAESEAPSTSESTYNVETSTTENAAQEGTATSDTPGGVLANTGASVLGLLVAAVLAVLVGVGMVRRSPR